MKKFVCDHPWTHFEVNNANGDVTMCCDNSAVLGNVNENSITEIWNGDRYRAMRERMAKDGAQTFCPLTCPVLQGGKRYQNLDWYRDLPKDNTAAQNARLNEREYKEKKEYLESFPRWMRFAYSYACNLDCYHCYQRDDALMRLKLPGKFMNEVVELSPHFQVILPFGGEPFLYRPVLDLMEKDRLAPGAKYFFITNATLFTDRVKKLLEAKNLLGIAVSLDAATEKSFAALRLRGRKGSWTEVTNNLAWLKTLRRSKGFKFSISMTLNSMNFDEIERFVDLGILYGAEPDIVLVANSYQTLEFQKDYLNFNDAQFDEMYRQIGVAIAKVEERQLHDSATALKILRQNLILHRRSDNNIAVYKAKNYVRGAIRLLPETVQNPIRKVVQEVRARLFESVSPDRS